MHKSLLNALLRGSIFIFFWQNIFGLGTKKSPAIFFFIKNFFSEALKLH